MQAVVERCRLLEFHRHVAFQDQAIVGAQRCRHVFGETLALGPPHDVRLTEMEQPLPLPVDEQEPPFRVLDGNDRGGVVENLLQPRLAVLELALHACALLDVAPQPRVRVGDLQRHRIERAAQSAELVVTVQVAAGREITRSELLGRMDESRRASREEEMEDEPQGERECGHPPRPVERLLLDLRARFRLVPLEIVGEEHAADPRRTQFLALAAHEDARVADQLVAARHDRHPRGPLARGAEVELRQHVGDRASEPGAARRRNDRVAVVRQRGERHVVVVREHGDLALGRGRITLEQQVFERALQPRHLLREALAAILLGHALGLRNVVQQIDGAERRCESQQQQRQRDLQ